MKTDRLLVLLVVAVALVGAAVWVQKGRETRRRPAGEAGAFVLPELQKPETLNAVASLVFAKADSTVRVSRAEGAWIAPDLYGHPVKADDVRKFLLTLADLKVGQTIPGGERQLLALGLLEPAVATNGQPREGSGTVVILADSNATALARLVIGKERRRGGAMGFADGRFVLAGGRPALVSETFSALPSRPVDWMNTQLVDLFSSDIDSLVYTPAGKPSMCLTNMLGELKLVDLATNEAMDSIKVSRISGIVSFLRFADVADPALSAADAGLDAPSVVVARARNGREFTVRIGKAAGTNAQRYVAVSAAFTPRPLPEAPAADAAEDVKKRYEEDTKTIKAENEKIETEIRELNARTSKWVYLVEGSRFDHLPESRGDLLQPPPSAATNAAPVAPSASSMEMPPPSVPPAAEPAATNGAPAAAPSAATPPATNSAPPAAG